MQIPSLMHMFASFDLAEENGRREVYFFSLFLTSVLINPTGPGFSWRLGPGRMGGGGGGGRKVRMNVNFFKWTSK